MLRNRKQLGLTEGIAVAMWQPCVVLSGVSHAHCLCSSLFDQKDGDYRAMQAEIAGSTGFNTSINRRYQV